MTDVAFRHFGHIVRMDGNSFQSITIPFDYVLFNSRIRKHNCTSFLRTSTELLDPGLTYYRGGGGYITKHRVVIVVTPNM